MRKRTLSHESRVVFLGVMAGLPGSATALALLWTGPYARELQWTLTVLILGLWWGCTLALRERVIFPLQTLANLLSALREGDFSIRGRSPRPDDVLGEVMREINQLSGMLCEQRLEALEATALLRIVMSEIDVAVFAFDEGQRLRLVNRAGERLLAQPSERLLGARAADLQLAGCLEPDSPQTFERQFPGGTGRWGVRRSTVREHGLPLQLLVISDLTRPLREEELLAWQRLVRVLGHELNNSLAPIKSIAESLASTMSRDSLPPGWQEDMRRGLAVITARSDSLSRFIGAYARLARLPRPRMQALEVSAWVSRAVSLETRLPVALAAGPEIVIHGDPDQLEQVPINLLRNAVDAVLETGGGVRAGWRRNGASVEVWVEDDGPGLSNTGNLFVPFFTTKPGGSGIGLVLSRQIVEAHGGALALENRQGVRGCLARLRLPV